MSYITSYPSSLKQLDLSHNKICVWPSLPQVHDGNLDSVEQAFISCYHQETGFKMSMNKLILGFTFLMSNIERKFDCTL